MEKKPLVSILCLSYNQSQFIIESLESIKNQTYQNFEILICDDFSKDDSAIKISNWISLNHSLKIIFIKHKSNKGICKSLNELFAIAKGKYIQMLALDDILFPHKLEKHVTILENSTINQAIVFSDALLIDDDSKFLDNRFIALHLKYLKIDTGNFYEKLIMSNFIPAMSVLLKTDCIKSVGKWDENLSYEDYDMWLRLSKDYDFIFDKTPSCKYRIHKNNTHKKSIFLENSKFDIYFKHRENHLAKEKLFNMVEKEYLNKSTSDKVKRYYSYYSSNSISDKLVKFNVGTNLYKLLKSYKDKF